MSVIFIRGDSRRIPLPDQSVHCVVTSPPYFRQRDYQVKGQIGLEETAEAYIAELVGVFREVKRVMRDDATLWLNLGDSYTATSCRNPSRFKPKDLMGIPWRAAFALQEDGWWLRSDIIWSKRSPMPHPVRDRPVCSHEYVFLLTKRPNYFYDWYAVLEKAVYGGKKVSLGEKSFSRRQASGAGVLGSGNAVAASYEVPAQRNLRSVWTLSNEPTKIKHFASFPTRLVLPMIRAGTSEHGCCPKCLAPWERTIAKQRVATRPGSGSKLYDGDDVVLDPDSPYRRHAGIIFGNRDPQRHVTSYVHNGWKPTCRCGISERAPCRVFDPFSGVGTTALVASNLGRLGIGVELNHEYCVCARDRVLRPHKEKKPMRIKPSPLFDREAS